MSKVTALTTQYAGISKALGVLGALALGWWALRVLGWLGSALFGRRGIDVGRRYAGRWAVVTGASFGLGEGFVRELARKGLNVVLLARSEDKLRAIAQELQASGCRSETKCRRFDFENATDAEWATLAAELNALQPAVLVNNVGVATDGPAFFHDAESGAKMESMIKVNITAANRMTHALLPGMIERKSGVVLFLSSGSALAPTPLLSVYAATKAYNNHFARSLHEELRGTGVWVQSYTPFFIASQMTKMRTSLFVPSNLSWAQQAVARIGREVVSQPYWGHRLMAALTSVVPEFVSRRMVWNAMYASYKRAQRKREAAQKQQ